MKIYCFTWDRYDTATTPGKLEAAGLPHMVVCHSEQARQRFIDAGTVKPENIVASGVPKGLALNRNWVLDNLVKDGEWHMHVVDDFLTITELDCYDKLTKAGIEKTECTIKNSTEWSRKFRTKIDFVKFHQRAEELAKYCDERGVLLGGWAGFTNSLFRVEHWKKNVLADGRAWVMKKSKLRLDPNVNLIDDICHCAQHIMNGTGVIVDNWILPAASRYTAGAFGSIEQRLPQKMAEAKYLVEHYPCVSFGDKKGWPAGSHVQLRVTNAAKSAMAQEEMFG